MSAAPESAAESLAARTIMVLADLVAFDTTSRGSNLELIEYVEDRLSNYGIASRRVLNEDGTKANLTATIGPMVEGGIVLSGHTDVVPVDGQPWSTDPWKLTEKDGRLYGRGSSDMKSFLALTLAALPELTIANLKRPVHIAFTYDEEVGCLGAPSLIDEILRTVPKPGAVLVGEPTEMQAISGHKGICTHAVTVTGHEAHSSLLHMGVSANMAAIRLMNSLVELSDELQRTANPNSPFEPKGSTLTIGLMNGGTAVNILAREAKFMFDLRTEPGDDAMEILAPFYAECARVDAELKARFPECGVKIEKFSQTPGCGPEENGAAEALARRLAGDNGPLRVAPYAAEAGQFQEAGLSTIICGPGSIDQAHQPDEFIEISQIERASEYMLRLVDYLQSDA